MNKFREKLNPWFVSWALGAVLFAIVVTWQNRGLTFFWDEWNVVWATVESPYFGLLQDNGGNFFPLSRAVFALELAIFGAWYPGYTFVTSLLFGFAAFAFNIVLDNGTRNRRIALTSFSLIYLSSTGVLFASSMGFMLIWGLSPLLAIVSAHFFIKRIQESPGNTRNLVFAWLLFLMSWLAFSSAITIMALLIIGIICSRTGWKKLTKIELRFSLALILVSVIATYVGLRLAELNPPLNPLIGSARETLTFALAADPASVTRLAIASALAGLLSVLTAVPLQNNEVNSWLVIAFNDYLWVLIGLVVTAIGLIYAFKKSLPSMQVVLLFLLLFGTNLIISIARTPLGHRYQTLWVFLAILVILSLITWLDALNLKPFTLLLTFMIVFAGVISTWHIATGASAIASIERQRELAISTKLNEPTTCLLEATRTLEQIAPTITAKQVCELVAALEGRQWILKRQLIDR